MHKTFVKLIVGMEAFFFLSLIMAFLYLSYVTGYKQSEHDALSVPLTGIFTGILVASSGTIWWAERMLKKGRQKSFQIWMLVTMGLGFIFLAGQAHEYWSLIGKEHMTISSSLFGTGFFAVTSFHALHVIMGLYAFVVMWLVARKGYFKNEDNWTVFESAGIYWHFVDVVWLIVFTVIYLLPHEAVLIR